MYSDLGSCTQIFESYWRPGLIQNMKHLCELVLPPTSHAHDKQDISLPVYTLCNLAGEPEVKASVPHWEETSCMALCKLHSTMMLPDRENGKLILSILLCRKTWEGAP